MGLEVHSKVRFTAPGHAASAYSVAVVASLQAPGHPELYVMRLPNGIYVNCQPSRLEEISDTVYDRTVKEETAKFGHTRR